MRVLTEEEIHYDPTLPQKTMTPKEFARIEARNEAKRLREHTRITIRGVKEITKDAICYNYSIEQNVNAVAKKMYVNKSIVTHVLKERGLYV